MATAVQIELRVDESGALQGVKAFDTSVKGTTASVRQLNAALAETNAKSGIQNLAREFTGGESSLRTMNAEIRSLQGSIFGDTRAAAEFLSTIKGVGEAMELAFPVFGSVALAGVFVMAIEKANELYEKWMDTAAAVDQYNEKAAKAAAQKFDQSSSLEDLNADLVKANQLLDELNQKKRDSGVEQVGGGIKQWIPAGIREAFAGNGLGAAAGMLQAYSPFTKGDSDKLNQSQGKSDQDRERQLEEDHKAALASIEDARTIADARLQGIAKVRAAQDAADKEAAENRNYLVAREKLLAEVADRGLKPTDLEYKTVNPNAGLSEENLAKQKAAAEAAAQTTALQRDQAHELMQLRNEATNAELRGSALYKAQEEQAIEELKEKDEDSIAFRDAIHEKFHAEEMRRMREELDQTQLIQARAATAGMTGIQKTQAEGDIQIGTIRGDDNLSDAAKAARVAAAQQETQAQILEQERTFSQQVDQIAEQSATHQISGFAKINADGKRQLDDLQKKFDAVYGHMDRSAPGGEAIYEQGVSALNRGKSSINANTADATAELAQRNAQETAQIEDEARVRSLSAEKQKTAAIEAEYQQRLEKYNEELQQQEISQDDYNRRVAAAAQERDAEMVQAAQSARQQMASQFDSLFKSLNHPLQALASMGERVASEAAAELVQRVQTHGKGLPQGAESSGVGGFFGDLLNSGGLRSLSRGDRYNRNQEVPAAQIEAPAAPGLLRRGAMADRVAEMPHAAAAATSSVFSVGTATIRVGSASIAFGGSASSGGSSGAGGSSTVDMLELSSGGGSRAAGVSSLLSGGSGSGGGGSESGGSMDAYSYPSALAFPSASSASASFGGGSTVGGAGSGGSPQAPASSSGGSAPSHGSGMTGVMSDLQKGTGLVKSAAGIFGGKGSAASSELQTTSKAMTEMIPNADGSDNTASGSGGSNGGMVGGGGIMANAGGAVSGGLGMFSAVEGNGGVGGALSGAMSGMKLGGAIGGPAGAAVGAAAGAVVGAIGIGGREKARVYDLKQVRPRITADQDSYNQGGMDYLSAYADVQSLDMAAKTATNAMGPAAQSYYQDTIKKEIQTAEQKFTNEQKAGRSMYTSTAAQYDIGADSIPHDGMAMLHKNERVIPSEQNKQITSVLNTHGSYLSAMRQGGGSASRGSSSGDVHVHFHAHDSKTAMQFLMNNKHVIRSAVNASYAENSGGSDA